MASVYQSCISQDQLKSLASVVLISFQLEIPESEIISRLTGSYDPVIFIHRSVDEFDCAYWLLFNRVATKDIVMAKEVFGVSKNLAEHVANVTDSQLRYMSSSTSTNFSLRFLPNTIKEVLSNTRENITYSILKKMQQSLQMPSNGRYK